MELLASQIGRIEPYALFPIIILVMSRLIGVKFSRALRASVCIGVGLVGFAMLFSYFMEFTRPMVETLAGIAGKEAVIIDVGWPVLASVIWASTISYFILPIMFLTNMILLKLEKTNTLNIDMWNYWHMALVGVLVNHLSGRTGIALASMIIICVINLKLSDWSALLVGRYYRLPGVAASNLNSLAFIPYAVLGNWLIERCPVIKNIGTQKEHQDKKFGAFFKEPYAATFLAGGVMSALAGYSVSETIEFAFKLTAVFMILPHIASFIQEGFTTLSEGMNSFVKKRSKEDRSINIGVNHMVLMGDASLIIVAVILSPILLLISFAFKWIPFFPLADLTNIIGIIVFVVAATNGNIFRSILLSIPVLVVSMKLSALMAPYYTEIAKATGYFQGEMTGTYITSSMNGGNPISVAIVGMAGTEYPLVFFFLLVALYFCAKWLKNYVSRSEKN